LGVAVVTLGFVSAFFPIFNRRDRPSKPFTYFSRLNQLSDKPFSQ